MALTPSTMLPLGTVAPDFRLPDTSGKPVALAESNGLAGLDVKHQTAEARPSSGEQQLLLLVDLFESRGAPDHSGKEDLMAARSLDEQRVAVGRERDSRGGSRRIEAQQSESGDDVPQPQGFVARDGGERSATGRYVQRIDAAAMTGNLRGGLREKRRSATS
jgi:hypothetical protein